MISASTGGVESQGTCFNTGFRAHGDESGTYQCAEGKEVRGEDDGHECREGEQNTCYGLIDCLPGDSKIVAQFELAHLEFILTFCGTFPENAHESLIVGSDATICGYTGCRTVCMGWTAFGDGITSKQCGEGLVPMEDGEGECRGDSCAARECCAHVCGEMVEECPAGMLRRDDDDMIWDSRPASQDECCYVGPSAPHTFWRTLRCYTPSNFSP